MQPAQHRQPRFPPADSSSSTPVFAPLPLKGCPKPAEFPARVLVQSIQQCSHTKLCHCECEEKELPGCWMAHQPTLCVSAAPWKSWAEIPLACGSDSTARSHSGSEKRFQREKRRGIREKKENSCPSWINLACEM